MSRKLPSFITRGVLPAALDLLYRSLRLKLDFRPAQENVSQGAAVFAFWHGKMAVGWLLARTLFGMRPLKAVVSLSGDGTILSDALDALGFSLIRGSSSSKGDQVRNGIEKCLLQGEAVAITPDGPRGPQHRFKYGSVRIASKLRTPLLFADIRYGSAWRLKSWDRFEVPKPFSRVDVILRRIEVPEFATEDDLRSWCESLSRELDHE
ncbi:DUF374 domain-containing protein [Chlorobium limicola]